MQAGNFSSWWHKKKLQDNFELSENERLKKDISRLEAAARQTAMWSDKVEKSKLNYIDVLSRIQIEELLTQRKPTLLFVEHDRAFCDNIATKSVLLRG